MSATPVCSIPSEPPLPPLRKGGVFTPSGRLRSRLAKTFATLNLVSTNKGVK